MNNTYDDVQVDGNTKTTSKYVCESADLKYTIIGENIKEDFNFLINDIPNKLDEALNELKAAAAITNAFYLENGTTVSDISKSYDTMFIHVSALKSSLEVLYSSFMKDIDNVNAELENNFGYWAFNKPKLAGKVTEPIDNVESN